MRVVLASASPRRRELLSALFDRFDVLPGNVDEEEHFTGSAGEGAERVARVKAEAVAKIAPDALVIAADTSVAVEGTVLQKPSDASDARRMLRLLSGRTHQVVTGVAVCTGKQSLSGVETTEVDFAPMTDEQICAYIATGEPMDKAGAYGIQGRASIFISGIRGCYFNVVGLPLFRLNRLLQDLGVEVWQDWRKEI